MHDEKWVLSKIVLFLLVILSNWALLFGFFFFWGGGLFVYFMFLDSYIAYIDVSPTLPNWLTQNKCTFIIFVLRPNQEIASFYKQIRRISLHLQMKIRIEGTPYVNIQTKTQNRCIVYNLTKIKYDWGRRFFKMNVLGFTLEYLRCNICICIYWYNS